MIDVYLHIKIYLNYFTGRLKHAELGTSLPLTFWVSAPKLLWLQLNTYILLFCSDLSAKLCRGLWFNRIHLPLFQNMSIKIYTNFFLYSGGYNLKTNYLKDKMRHGTWVYTLLNNLVSSPLQHKYYFWQGGQNATKKQKYFILRYFCRVFVLSNN